MFSKAIVRPPAKTFAAGLTTSKLGPPDYVRAVEQHEAYREALEKCGLTLIRLEPDERYPDSTFVEDTAVIAKSRAILTRPGARSRRGEAEILASVLPNFFHDVAAIREPGTVDGGDICEAGDRFFIGLSERTNENGAAQLSSLLTEAGCQASTIDIRSSNLLHLKSGIAYLGDNRLVVVDGLPIGAFDDFEIVAVDKGESYAANCVRVNDCVLIARGFPKIESTLRKLSYQTISLEMSEFQKMDGGLSCLSVRF